ncbi:hypothetical protein [Beggiatoa leptomitoformis]|uniref:Uncharacterized protein n=1 Tax=Beggiatoa leptomitoformis TaxID=288004 RepID=A0A2N9YGW0_9GAMM|nr:hypothetical protein [Beggiatoa leptomitoformis]ALG68247.1 hypothetical protein AL038_11660 [Beggiatoa leptomitoformis]AUI69446.1 hypothetical protein BLE401_12610 [Beggiatoa leptomitoformis]
MKLITDILAWLIYKSFIIIFISILFFSMTFLYQQANNIIYSQDLPTLSAQIVQINEPITVTLNHTGISFLKGACATASDIAHRLDQTTKQFLQQIEPPNPFLHPIDYFLWKKGEQIFVTKQNELISSFNQQTDECNKILSQQQKVNQEKVQLINVQIEVLTEKIKNIRVSINSSGDSNGQRVKTLEALRTERQALANEKVKHEIIIANTSQENEQHHETLKAWEKEIAYLANKIEGSNNEINKVKRIEPHSILEFLEHRRWERTLNTMSMELNTMRQQYGDLINAKIRLEQTSATIISENEKRKTVFPLIDTQIAELTEKIKQLRSELKGQNALIAELDMLREQRQKLAKEESMLEQTVSEGSQQLLKIINPLNNNDLFWKTYQIFTSSIFMLVFIIMFGNYLQKAFWYFIVAKLASHTRPIQVLQNY